MLFLAAFEAVLRLTSTSGVKIGGFGLLEANLEVIGADGVSLEATEAVEATGNIVTTGGCEALTEAKLGAEFLEVTVMLTSDPDKALAYCMASDVMEAT